MRRQARIVRISEHFLEAVLERSAACAACKNGCGNQSFNWLVGKNRDRILIVRHSAWARGKRPLTKKALVDIDDFFGARPHIDQRFTLELDEGAMLKSAIRLYAMPLVLMVSGLALGYVLFTSYGGPGDLGGILGFVAGLLTARFLVRRQPLTPSVHFS